MNRIIITMLGLKYDGWLIENIADLETYREMTDPTFNKNKHAVTREYYPTERFDSIAYQSQYGPILKHVLSTQCGDDGTHLNLLSKIYDKKMLRMANIVLNGERIIVNDSGGYCTILHDNYQITETYKRKLIYSIKPLTSWINLENDPYLESYTINILGKTDKNFSYILESGRLSEHELMSILSEFKRLGGKGIWQYTTASNIDQLYMYIDCGIKVGLTKFEINFNSGTNPFIKLLVDFYESNKDIEFNHNYT